MNKISNLKKDVPATENDFTVEIDGSLTKRRFIGEFRCRIPRRKEQCLIDKHRAFLNGSLVDQLEPETIRFHHMISYLRYTLDTKTAPKWWTESDLGYELFDVNVVEEIYNKVLAFEEEWLKEIWGEEFEKRFQKSEKQNGAEQEQTAEKGA